MAAFNTAIAGRAGQPQHAFAALHNLTRAVIGARLFTVMRFDAGRGVAARLFSSDPVAYPVAGEKPVQPDHWSDLVLNRHQPFVANDLATIAGVFADHEQIAALGCQSCLNLPLVAGGRVLGTLNCLDVAGHYTPQRVADAAVLVAPGLAAMWLAAAGAAGQAGAKTSAVGS